MSDSSTPSARLARVGSDLWIFGYGSLLWRPDFAHAEVRRGWIADWERRFWQGSMDHRGVPEAPGRVVTLISSPGAACWGRVYRVEAAQADATTEKLDWRERGGFRRLSLRVHLEHAGGPSVEALTYVAESDNPNYLGPAPLDAIAAQVRGAHGPSGANIEYVQRLAESLRELRADDPHVFALDVLLRNQAPPSTRRN